MMRTTTFYSVEVPRHLAGSQTDAIDFVQHNPQYALEHGHIIQQDHDQGVYVPIPAEDEGDNNQ
jgi:hypothetical protein